MPYTAACAIHFSALCFASPACPEHTPRHPPQPLPLRLGLFPADLNWLAPAVSAVIFRTFDFDADERWQSYRQKLEFPAGSDESALLQRMKQKWYKREIDPSFDVGQREPTST